MLLNNFIPPLVIGNTLKFAGIRQKRYVLKSIGYFNFLKFYQRFKNIAQNRFRLAQILNELKTRKDKLGELNGYNVIKTRVKEFLEQFKVIEFGINIFQKAIEDFKKVN